MSRRGNPPDKVETASTQAELLPGKKVGQVVQSDCQAMSGWKACPPCGSFVLASLPSTALLEPMLGKVLTPAPRLRDRGAVAWPLPWCAQLLGKTVLLAVNPPRHAALGPIVSQGLPGRCFKLVFACLARISSSIPKYRSVQD